MTVGNAIVNQALGAANRTMSGGLKKVLGNLPGSALRGRSVVSGLPAQGSPTMNLSYPMDVETNSQQGHYIMFMINVTSPALIEKHSGRFRYQLIIQASNRKNLHAHMDKWLQKLETMKGSKTVRWSLDIDPQDMS